MKESNLVQYGGKWRVYEDTAWYDGTLYVDEDNRRLRLEVTIPSEEGNPMPRLPYVGFVPFVNGVLYNGAKALLYDCTIGFEHAYLYQYSQQVVFPQYCFIGLSIEKEDELCFSKVEFDFGEIINWSLLCEYKWDWTGNGNPVIQWNCHPDVVFQLREGVEARFRPYVPSTPLSSTKVDTNIAQRVVVELQYETQCSWNTIIDDVMSLRYFIGLGMNRYIGIESALYYHSSLFEKIPDKQGFIERPVPMEVWFGTEEIVHTTEGHPHEYSFTLPECNDYQMLNNWSGLYPILKPVLDLYFVSGRFNIHVPEIVFLHLMQALETYHARFVADTKQDYINHVEQELAEFNKGGDDFGHWREILISPQQESQNCNTVYLKSRLEDLIFAEGVICWWSFNTKAGERFAEKLVNTRNYYTHYDEKKKAKAYSKDELPFVNRHLRCLLKYHLLTRLGYDKQCARKKMVEERNMIDTSYTIFSQENKVSIEKGNKR